MSTGQLTAHSGRQPGSSRAGPRDSAALRQQLAARAPLLSCERLLFSDNPMTIASIATGHCPASEVRGDACYLLSQDRLAGSHRSLDCLALRRDRRNRNLPAFHAWGFVAPSCWSYVEILRRAFRPPRLMPPGADNRLAHLARDAVQGWAHPDHSGRLRVAVLGSCLPFLLDDVPHLLGQGDVRHDAVSTTITRSRGSFEEKRHLSVVQRVVVDADTAHALTRARHTHAAALNPLVTGVNEVEDAHAREFRRLRRTVRGAGGVLLLNVLVIALNIVVIWRGMCSWETPTLSPDPSSNPGHLTLAITLALTPGLSLAPTRWIWNLIQQLQLVQWVQQASPHFPVTMQAIRLLDTLTLPFRALLGPLARPAEVKPRRTAGRALRAVGRGLRAVGEAAGRGLRSATGGGASIAQRRPIDV